MYFLFAAGRLPAPDICQGWPTDDEIVFVIIGSLPIPTPDLAVKDAPYPLPFAPKLAKLSPGYRWKAV
jgi:hypothetical protein